jgi:flagellar basal-body rod protein FlgC
MNDFLALDVSGAGMRAQRMRMQVISENLANQHTIGPNGPYQRKDVVFQTVPVNSFQQNLDEAVDTLAGPNSLPPLQSVTVSNVRTDNADPVQVYDPANPQADAKGFVSYPNISDFREMTDMIEASRSYEANLAVSKTTLQMLTSAMDLVQK